MNTNSNIYKSPPSYSVEEAARLGYKSITRPYSERSENDRKYLVNVLRDMVGLEHCLIETVYGVEVGRLELDLL